MRVSMEYTHLLQGDQHLISLVWLGKMRSDLIRVAIVKGCKGGPQAGTAGTWHCVSPISL